MPQEAIPGPGPVPPGGPCGRLRGPEDPRDRPKMQAPGAPGGEPQVGAPRTHTKHAVPIRLQSDSKRGSPERRAPSKLCPRRARFVTIRRSVLRVTLKPAPGRAESRAAWRLRPCIWAAA